ncbi:hypothetical protein FA13DRAFT_1874782 [Coprinellus micaceus]|uniref:Uncharacterized protein n=1 Tax=Coprinellus micaceus TaxID=71717 RepID=A0A4Y7S3P5_COPMI|nr:hypothetical protein FA13DRAFT_1874782 [Coprinellus micaceus]
MRGSPFRVLVTGRPSLVLHTALQPNGTLYATSQHLRLSDDKDYDATEDIRFSLRNQLGRVVARPTLDDDVEIIVGAASGQYIYPATVIKYVSQLRSRARPTERLDTVLAWIDGDDSTLLESHPIGSGSAGSECGSLSEYPLAALDSLYRSILSAAAAEYIVSKESSDDDSVR